MKPPFNRSTLRDLKRRIIKLVEFLLDPALDVLLHPAWFSSASLERTNKVRVGSWFYYDYVFNQKAQRLQLLAKMRAQGCKDPPRFHAWWPRGRPRNFGDLLTAYILSMAAHVDCVYDKGEPFSAVGSTIRLALDGTRVWGSGIIRSNEVIPASPVCLAVRGPLTRERVLAADLECPEIYGDPAMLLEYIYTPPKQDKLHHVSLAPHFNHAFLGQAPCTAHYIDVRVRNIKDIEAVIDQITASRIVITSSLHVFIACVTYSIPVAVFQIPGKSIHGDNIKFRDFCLGVGLEPVRLFQVDAIDDEIIAELSSKAMVYKASWDPLPLLKALRSVTSTPRLSNLIKRLERGARSEQINKRGKPFSKTPSTETGEKSKP